MVEKAPGLRATRPLHGDRAETYTFTLRKVGKAGQSVYGSTTGEEKGHRRDEVGGW